MGTELTLIIIAVAVGAGWVAYRLVTRLVTRLAPPASAPGQDRRLAEQAEQIEVLEVELQRLKDQADFTERLLTERGGAQPGDATEGSDRD